ncbi:MAG: plasmid mobilization relaxosome protein MobC [Micavibrio aeruginosavorus]|uniref:Plasmid mobilization relaxosome protein MobC n=1 Tax=Micavibrio aeruginosavorus TaxID=349221 RepID=A0A7T5R0C3_9BACT|nr:MAG: plasmid mobilization relaxosome protein MobC [Micavibrio aeruginosavorus]
MSLDHPPIAGEFQDAAEHNASRIRRIGSPPPFSLRLTVEEKALLMSEAKGVPLGAYIRSKLLGGAASHRRSYRSPLKDDKILAQLLGELGKARLANNLNQLAKAANTGSLSVTPETEKAIQDACRDVQWMRDRLIAALGLGPGGPK